MFDELYLLFISASDSSLGGPSLKTGKCASVAVSYSPISITSVISKTMERMMNARLYHNLEQSACLDEPQSGFQRHRTSVAQLVHFTQRVIKARQAKSHTVSVHMQKSRIECGTALCM
ncbi:RNA-directed DNA polymerase from mobile element jockey-like protein [Plakobranchus ocellatus]|uniref:RNA-directed DNA polymerase from mobile element jockey-like protein n=1 Tax=Plakobranchus ocellatus TaxID=259542 RepID=A0AAV4DDA6_9GAST|nr:RNA-directed DNA polymerase from mobile element jockey-like protein [Plakobranchus ocellatus]